MVKEYKLCKSWGKDYLENLYFLYPSICGTPRNMWEQKMQ